MSRPLIAVTCSTFYGKPWGEYSNNQRLDYVPQEYIASVEMAGGLPLCLPLVEDPETIGAIMERVDGLILTGGPDINPQFYDQEPRPNLGEIDYELDLLELETARMAVDTGRPVLGICRGIQLLAAAFGGELIQDIPTETENTLNHDQKASKAVMTHKVFIDRSSLLHEIVGQEEIWVNSKHHQAVGTLPQGFAAAAHSSDGLIEAMENPNYPFLLGLQWHPEGTSGVDEPSLRIFQALVEACR